MNSLQNKFLKREYRQTNIMSAINNMKEVSRRQKMKKEYLSNTIIEIHSSDSEREEHFSSRKIITKRRKPFSSYDEISESPLKAKKETGKS